jgi:hypothetical protein
MYVFIDEWEVGQYARILHNHGEALELPFNSTRGLVRSWLFCKQIFLYLVRFLKHVWVGVDVWTKNLLCPFIMGQTHCGMPDAKGVFTSGERFPLVECISNTNFLNKKVSMCKYHDFLEWKPISKLVLMTFMHGLDPTRENYWFHLI